MLRWLRRDQDVNSLIAHKNYPKAIEVLERQLRKDPRSVHLRQLLADVLARAGERERAVEVLEPLVEEFLADGFVSKAVAVLKKIQRIDRRRPDISYRLASLLEPADGESPEEAAAAAANAERSKEGDPATTSVIVNNWLEDAMEKRRDFQWSPLLSGFSDHERASLIGGLRLLVKKPGAVIYGEDEPGESLFILASGEARVYRRNGVGRYEQVGMRREGQFFGEGSVLTTGNRRSTVIAATECELLELDKETIERVSEKNPELREMIRQVHDERTSRELASWG